MHQDYAVQHIHQLRCDWAWPSNQTIYNDGGYIFSISLHCSKSWAKIVAALKHLSANPTYRHCSRTTLAMCSHEQMKGYGTKRKKNDEACRLTLRRTDRGCTEGTSLSSWHSTVPSTTETSHVVTQATLTCGHVAGGHVATIVVWVSLSYHKTDQNNSNVIVNEDSSDKTWR